MTGDDGGLPAERTALAWHRTGLAHITAGALMLRLLPATAFRPVVGGGLVLIGALASWAAGRRGSTARRHALLLRALAGGTTAVAAVAVVLVV